jgi:hypothetical protein
MRPDVQAQCSMLRGNPSTATATTLAKPGPASATSSLVTVLNSAAPVAIARYTFSGAPSERSMAATCELPSRPAASIPTARANSGWWVTRAPARQSAIASS